MNRLTINLDALAHNYETIHRWVSRHGGSLTVVTKALCGHEDLLRALESFGATSMGDSRIENLRAIRDAAPSAETWYLRPPHASALQTLVPLSDISLNSELFTIQQINEACHQIGAHHGVVLMVELGDLREGILPGSLLEITSKILEMPQITLAGVGANLGCLHGAVPMAEELAQLCLYHELLELKFDIQIPYVSAGTSAALGLLREGGLPDAVNHFRIGEAIVLGTDPSTGERFPGLRDDVVAVEAEIVELKEKRLMAPLEGSGATFDSLESEEDLEPGQRGFRAIVTIGHVDTEVGGLVPLDPACSLAGASSDVAVVNLGDENRGKTVGDTLSFRPSYSAFVRLMNNRYTSIRLKHQEATVSPAHRKLEPSSMSA